jgi:hypothetical protein
MDTILKQGDFFQGNEVTRVSDKFCFFGKTRMGWNKIKKLVDSGETIQFRSSPDKIVDWSDKDDVIKYYNSFARYNTYICNGDRGTKAVVEVKDGLVFHEGEYWLPSAVGWDQNKMDLNNPVNWEGKPISDGLYNVTLYKKKNSWYETLANENTINLNIFIRGYEVKSKSDVSNLVNNNNEIYAYRYGHEVTFDYTHSNWNGVSIEYISIDLQKFFKKYYVDYMWGEGKRISLTENQIYEIVYPIEGSISSILAECAQNGSYYADCYDQYGEFSINNLKLNETVCSKIFTLINNRLKTIVL